jgi:hypothetical protein
LDWLVYLYFGLDISHLTGCIDEDKTGLVGQMVGSAGLYLYWALFDSWFKTESLIFGLVISYFPMKKC